MSVWGAQSIPNDSDHEIVLDSIEVANGSTLDPIATSVSIDESRAGRSFPAAGVDFPFRPVSSTSDAVADDVEGARVPAGSSAQVLMAFRDPSEPSFITGLVVRYHDSDGAHEVTTRHKLLIADNACSSDFTVPDP